MVKEITIKCDPKEIFDGYHTIGELYDHRHLLFLTAMKLNPSECWISKQHDDGTMFDDMFIGCLMLNGRPVDYHMPMKLWDIATQTGAEVLERGKPWDGHTSENVLSHMLLFLDP